MAIYYWMWATSRLRRSRFRSYLRTRGTLAAFSAYSMAQQLPTDVIIVNSFVQDTMRYFERRLNE